MCLALFLEFTSILENGEGAFNLQHCSKIRYVTVTPMATRYCDVNSRYEVEREISSSAIENVSKKHPWSSCSRLEAAYTEYLAQKCFPYTYLLSVRQSIRLEAAYRISLFVHAKRLSKTSLTYYQSVRQTNCSIGAIFKFGHHTLAHNYTQERRKETSCAV